MSRFWCPRCKANVSESTHVTHDPNVPEFSWETCGDQLMEKGWEEGFRCVLMPLHNGPHRQQTWTQEALAGVDNKGRKYSYAMEWTWEK